MLDIALRLRLPVLLSSWVCARGALTTHCCQGGDRMRAACSCPVGFANCIDPQMRVLQSNVDDLRVAFARTVVAQVAFGRAAAPAGKRSGKARSD
jgi:hypothetical protein